jgi:hypothetical protein
MILFVKDKSIGAYSSSEEGMIIDSLVTETYPELKKLGLKDECRGFMTFDGISEKDMCDKLNFLGFSTFLD